jgi:flavodoxin
MTKILVSYFSASGVTAKAASKLAESEGADLYEIRPETPYTVADLNWMNGKSRSSVEMADPNCRPKIDGTFENMEMYDVVFVGFPIWWGREPSIIDTFLESYDFSGKTIIPFCTSGGSGIGNTAERIRSIVGENVTVDEGRRLGGMISPGDLVDWLKGLIH